MEDFPKYLLTNEYHYHLHRERQSDACHRRPRGDASRRCCGADDGGKSGHGYSLRGGDISIIQGNRNIVEKLDGQNVRLSRLEQIIEDAHLSEIPPQIAAIEASVKSAHHRIDALERK